MHLLLSIQDLNNQMDFAINIAWVLLALGLLVIACLCYVKYWEDEIKYICEDCEFDKDKFCKKCGTHEYEKQLIK